MRPDELASARDSQLLSLPALFETNETIGATLSDLFVFDLPDNYYQLLPAQFAQVTAQQAMQAARKYLVPEQMVVVAVGDRAKIGSQLNAL
jgi:zinc protease